MKAARADKDLRALVDLDKTVHEPGRLAVLAYLYVAHSADFVFLMRHTGLTRGNLSAHMTKLEQAGHVAVTKEFVDRIPRTLYRLTTSGRNTFRDYRARLIGALGALRD